MCGQTLQYAVSVRSQTSAGVMGYGHPDGACDPEDIRVHRGQLAAKTNMVLANAERHGRTL